MATSTVLIVNPQARNGWPRKKWPVIEPELRAALGPLTLRFTRHAGEGRPLAKAAVQAGAKLVVAMGGDGTVSEVAAGILEAQAESASPEPTCALGYVPCATGGDLRRTLDLPSDFSAAAQHIMRAKPRLVDAGQLDYLDHQGRPARGYFLNIASCGLSGLVDHMVNQSSKALGGGATFLMAALRASMHYRNARVRIRLDDKPAEERTIYTLAVANGRYFGGGMHVAPEARIDDGLFDVVTLGDLSVPELLRLAPLVYRGEHAGHSKIHFARARTIRVEPVDLENLPQRSGSPAQGSENPAQRSGYHTVAKVGSSPKILLDVDGEAPGRLPATWTILPKALLLRG